MVKRILTVILILIMILTAGSSQAGLKLWESTPGQQRLKAYIEKVNEFLLENGEEEINKCFDQRNDLVELGIVSDPDSENSYMPEDVVVTVYMHYDSLYYMILRVNSAERFPKIASAFLRALNPRTMTPADSLKTPNERASKAVSNPKSSFVDVEFDKYAEKEIEIMSAEKPQTYYAYYPNQYKDGVSWMQLMIIFPAAEYWDTENGVITTGEDEAAKPYVDKMLPDGYEGYFADDYYEHYREETSPTPEPDSAAGEDSWY